MRSKEVEKAIKSLENFVNQKYYNGVSADEMKTVLAYIEELENARSPYFLPKAVIRDKIKELDEEEQELQNSISEEEREEYSDANISFLLCEIETRRKVLKDLLKGE